MGVWGTDSYDNDSVMDAVGACKDTDAPTQDEADKILDGEWCDESDNPEMYYHVLGCIVFFLLNGCDVKIEYLLKCIDTFIPYELENNSYNNPQKRIQSLQSECNMIQSEINRLLFREKLFVIPTFPN